MTLREFLESGIDLEGQKKVQCWEDEDAPTVYYEGNGIDIAEEYKERKITHIYPYTEAYSSRRTCPTYIAVICIELEATSN